MAQMLEQQPFVLSLSQYERIIINHLKSFSARRESGEGRTKRFFAAC
jgi:hypothetical protein